MAKPTDGAQQRRRTTPSPDENKETRKVSSKSKSQRSRTSLGGKVWRQMGRRILILVVLIACVFGYRWYRRRASNYDESVLASAQERILGSPRGQELPCAEEIVGADKPHFPGCSPSRCARMVTDELVTEEEARKLVTLAIKGLSLGGSSGGASILDLHSGALSLGESFVNVYKLAGSEKLFTEDDFEIYARVKRKVHQMITTQFRLDPSKLFLTHPTFFSRMTAKKAVNVHDEYWHVHVDRKTYGSFVYTSLLYLSTWGKDFEGGRFYFVGNEKNITIQPRLGRVSAFTSSAENPHFVEPVTRGSRLALTIAFTCDPSQAIEDPKIGGLGKEEKAG